MSEEYNKFIEKFKPKKTTDDCYTPPKIFKCVLDYLNLTDDEIERPFYPNGDYVNYPYSSKPVVDNPPFSIISEVVRFFVDNDIKFFLFAPTLTLFNIAVDKRVCYIPVGATITYENGAVVNTSFVTNMFNEKVITSSKLFEKLNATNKVDKKLLPKYIYPRNVLTVTKCINMVKNGIDFKVEQNNAAFISRLSSQKESKKTLFGGGFLISDNCAITAEKAAEKAAERASENVFEWVLLDQEKNIINKLNKYQ